MNVQTRKEGFTIIEVVLVLAIAGLIFLMVFIALPALQRNQRDTARKADISTVSSAYGDYLGNNRGGEPTAEKLQTYITDVSENTDPAKVDVVAYATSVNVSDTEVIVVKGARCGDTGAAVADPDEDEGEKSAPMTLTRGTNRQFATVGYLEAGGGTSYCLEG